MTKELPISFNSEMVRAILDGHKTQTRRVVKIDKKLKEDFFNDKDASMSCPYGKLGDRLWVREAFSWLPDGMNADENDGRFYFRADGDMPVKWKPSIHMPRAASRITLEITDIRVERLNIISCADSIAEGIRVNTNYNDIDCDTPNPQKKYRKLWESINGKGSWELNPWVWVIEFERIIR